MSQQPCCQDHYASALEHKDLLAMQILSPLSSAYLPWSASAMRPSGIVAVLNEIVVNRRRCIVELGGGISTFYLGRLLSRRGDGHLWTVEHDDEWADRLKEQLAGEDLDAQVTVVRAALTPISAAWPGEDATWYDRDALTEITAGQPIDLLIVDGPPAWQAGRSHARYPAVPHFAPMLADDYAVFLDDIDRSGEQDILDRWNRELGITFERRLVNGRIGIGRPQPAFSV